MRKLSTNNVYNHEQQNLRRDIHVKVQSIHGHLRAIRKLEEDIEVLKALIIEKSNPKNRDAVVKRVNALKCKWS